MLKKLVDGYQEMESPNLRILKKILYNSNRKHIYQAPNLQNAYVNIANKLKAVGANGIINLKISLINSNYSDKIVITGMAIKK